MSATSFMKLIDQMMNCSGITEDDFRILLSSNHILTDEMIFAVTRYIESIKGINVFFSRTIGNIEVTARFFDIAVDYVIYDSNRRVTAAVAVNLNTLTLFVEFPVIKEKYTIDHDLLDFEDDKKNKLSLLRMQVLNDVLTRYYTRILHSIYMQKRRG